MIFRSLLAHQWGWDEILYFIVPAVGAVLWIRWAEKRARSRRQTPGTNMTGPDE